MYAQIKGEEVVKYPYRERNQREDNPLVSFPKNSLANNSIRDKYSIVEVALIEAPLKSGYTPVEATPSFDGASWTQNWKHELKAPNEVLSSEMDEEVRPPVTNGEIPVEAMPEFVNGKWKRTWLWEKAGYSLLREQEYGETRDQIEFITENGLEAWQTKVAEIKAKYPKS